MSQKFDDSLFEDKPFETQEMDDSLFEDTKFEKPTQQDAGLPKEISKGQSALKGSQQGLTFGFADEMGAGIETGLDKTQAFLHKMGLAEESPSQMADRMRAEGMTGDIGPGQDELYQDNLEKQRKSFKEAEEANPNSFLAGEIGAGLLIPGGATAKALSKGGKLAKTAKLATIGATGGAAVGAGQAESNEEIVPNMIEGAGAGAVANTVIPGAAKLAGKGLKKGGEIVKEIPYIENLFKAYKQGLKGNKVAGTKAFEEIGDEAIQKSKQFGKQLDDEGSRLAREQSELLDQSDQTFDLSQRFKQLKDQTKEIDPIGNAPKQDIKEIDSVVDDIMSTYGDKNVSAKTAKKLDDRLKEFSGVKDGEVPELRTREARGIVGSAEKELREDLYENVEGLRDKNNLITEFNSAMDELGLSKVNQAFVSAKDKAQIKKRLFSSIKNLGKETDSSIIARDSVNQLEEVLQRTNPELAEEIIPQLTDVAERLDLAKRSVGGGNIVGSLLNIEGYGITAGNAVGRAVGPAIPKQTKQVTKAIKMSGDRLNKMSNADLIDMSKLIGYKYGKPANKLVQSLGKMGETTNARQRQAIVFGILQDPEARKMLNVVNADEE